MRITTLIISIFFLKIIYAQDNTSFETLLEKNKLEFHIPDGYFETNVIENGDLFYNYAIKLEQDTFEVRYSIISLYPLFEEYEESLVDSNTVFSTDPNEIHETLYLANILNVSQLGFENLPQILDFNLEAVKDEFGADFGCTSFFPANSEFAKNYKYCSMILIHKEDIADVYMSFLCNNLDTFKKHLPNVIHSIKFKD